MTREEIINDVLDNWASDFIINLKKASADKIGGKGSKSIDVDIVKATTQTIAMATIVFPEYLRYYDMKKVYRKGNVPVDEIKAWVENVGLSKFKRNTPSDLRSLSLGSALRVLTDKELISQIAWRIARSRTPLKRKKWYNKRKGGSVYNLYFKLAEGLLPVLLDEVKAKIL